MYPLFFYNMPHMCMRQQEQDPLVGAALVVETHPAAAFDDKQGQKARALSTCYAMASFAACLLLAWQ